MLHKVKNKKQWEFVKETADEKEANKSMLSQN
jgi:hypothetical protein